ncbi:putative glycosyl hydrolase [Bisporella sp. PMI_857]|nr:putative glycosyl hydrolase [Bisporella sp. PMI_857]
MAGGVYNMVTSVSLVAVMMITCTSALSPPPRQVAKPDLTTSEAGNPFVDGWYADPDTEIYNGLYWVYPTASYEYGEQTYLDAFSSPDLINWTKHPNVLTRADVSWVRGALWAPAPISRNGKYYLYFGANDLQVDDPANGILGGIGVAVADKPGGPYVDAIGKPLIGNFHNGAQPIDQDVFIDDVDGQAYIYYGGWSHANVAKLNEDMISLGTFDDGQTFKEITPENYVEGSQIFKRNGKYYFMWSEGGWTGPDYSVSYAIADSPLGPFERIAKILQQNSAVAKGSGHNSVVHVPDTDIWYIFYHRRPLSETVGNHRVLAYDRLYFNDDGTIASVKMLVKDNFADGNMVGWRTYDGDWSVANKLLTAKSSAGGKAVLDTNFTDLIFDATVTITQATWTTGDAGLVFRATNLGSGMDAYSGYYAGISPSGRIVLGKADSGSWAVLKEVAFTVALNKQYSVRVSAIASEIRVFVDDLNSAKIIVSDSTFTSGADGVRVFQTSASFGNVSVAES